MSAGPSILRIKRKRGEEPIESLLVQNLDGSKRVRTEQSYIFHRLVKGGEHAYDGRVTSTPDQGSTVKSQPETRLRQARKTTTPRRFHLSRPTASSHKDEQSQLGNGSNDRPNIAVLVEDRPVPALAKREEMSTAQQSSQSTPFTSQTISKKPPGARYGTPRPPPQRKRMQSISLEKRATFEQWAEEERKTMVVGDSTAPNSVTAPTITPGQFGVASSEHGGGQVSKRAPDQDAMDTDDEGDYVYDTYIRHNMQTDEGSTGLDESGLEDLRQPLDTEAGNVGYLVISDLDIELWEMYASDPDEANDKDDWDSEQDDENAENFYGADYPEDEVSSDDEHGTNAYRYRTKTGGQSDDEEYDLADNSSDDEEVQKMEPWRRQMAARTGVYRLGVGEVNRRRRLGTTAADDDDDDDDDEGI